MRLWIVLLSVCKVTSPFPLPPLIPIKRYFLIAKFLFQILNKRSIRKKNLTLSLWCVLMFVCKFANMNTAKRKKVSNTPILNLLANNIKYYRSKFKMSQEQLAELAELHPTYISNIEQGKRNISLQNVYQIANAFNMSVSDLLKDKDL